MPKSMNRFVDFMPAVYRRLYTSDEMGQHAAIASRRGEQLVHAEMWQSTKGPMLCVVAVDRPGLLALITDALLTQGMAIQSARAFCREMGNAQIEAVDFLELRSAQGTNEVAAELEEDSLKAFAQFLSDLVADDLARDKSPKSAPRAPNQPATRVYFERQAPTEGRYLLVIEAPDSTGLLHAVSSALHSKDMRIMACEIRTIGGRARDRFELEPSSGRSLSDGELCDVQLSVLNALSSRY
jgi:UTP:GlnB (protein PII) uridylyltransferase